MEKQLQAKDARDRTACRVIAKPLAACSHTLFMPVTIEPASNADRDWCAALMAGNEPWITLRRGLEACRGALERPRTELFVAREGDARLGLILLDPWGVAGSPYVASIAVAEAARGRGVGSELMAFAERHFAGRKHLFLCVSSFNPRAQALYRRLGYEYMATFKDYVVAGLSELLFHKRLS